MNDDGSLRYEISSARNALEELMCNGDVSKRAFARLGHFFYKSRRRKRSYARQWLKTVGYAGSRRPGFDPTAISTRHTSARSDRGP
jgi:hypothetical protein